MANPTSKIQLSPAHAKRVIQDWIEDEEHLEVIRGWPDLYEAYLALRAFSCSESETKARRPEPDDDPASMAGSWRYENAGNPTDGQLMDQLETAFEKMNDGYVCMDMALRKRLAITLNEFMRPAVKSESKHSVPAGVRLTLSEPQASLGSTAGAESSGQITKGEPLC